jgi:hypothetical protein
MKVDEFRELVNKYLKPAATAIGMQLVDSSLARSEPDDSLRYILLALRADASGAREIYGEMEFLHSEIEDRADVHMWLHRSFRNAVDFLARLAMKEGGLAKACRPEMETRQIPGVQQEVDIRYETPADDDGA